MLLLIDEVGREADESGLPARHRRLPPGLAAQLRIGAASQPSSIAKDSRLNVIGRVQHFGQTSIAERYARYRPAVHQRIIDQLLRDLPPSVGRSLAVDVGCGTGQGSRPLADHFATVHAYDISQAMLTEAGAFPHVRYRLVPAEDLPDGNACADLVITGLAFHWFDQETFLQEAWRILHPGGVLAVYNCWLTGPSIHHPPLRDWFRHTYPARFPPPARHGHGIITRLSEADIPDFLPGGTIDEGFPVSFSLRELTRYLSTQSNITTHLAEGGDLAEVDRWLEEQLAPLFVGQRMDLPYRARVEWVVKPTASES